MNYVKIEFKGGWALLAESEFNPAKHKLYVEPKEKPEPAEEVTENVTRRRGRARKN